VPKPRTGIKSGNGKREAQPEIVVNDKSRFVPVPKPKQKLNQVTGM